MSRACKYNFELDLSQILLRCIHKDAAERKRVVSQKQAPEMKSKYARCQGAHLGLLHTERVVV